MRIRLTICSRLLALASLACHAGFGQVPSITAGGAVNAASFSSPLAPGEMIAIFGTNLATGGQVSASPPYPKSLAGTSVTIGGIPAPLSFVSSTQINAQVPSSLPATATAGVVVTTAAGSSLAEIDGMVSGAPGFFTADGSGCGQAAALNVKPDGTTSLNSTSNSASQGDYVALFGTGFGLAAQQPADGAAAIAASPLQTEPSLSIDGNPVASLSYSGLAPTLAGVDQINFQISASTRNGCAVPVLASQTLGSPAVTISVANGGGKCSDPPIQSWGQILLASYPTEPVLNAAFVTASFPSGPNVQPAAPQTIVYAPGWIGDVPQVGNIILSAYPIDIRTCAVPGYSYLSAGAIQIQPPAGSAVTLQPRPLTSGGVTYNAILPTGFLTQGTYTISGTAGNTVSLNTTLQVGSPIQILTPFTPGTVISSSQPLTVQWTGGDSGSLVKVELSSTQANGAGSYSYSYADATDGSLTIRPACTGHGGDETPVICTFGLPYSSNAQITVEVVPNPAVSPPVSVPGITGPVQIAWSYTYSFPGLVLSQ